MSTYLIKCHVCNDVFEHEANFIANVMREELPDGRTALLVTCNLRGRVHDSATVRASWRRLNGEALARVGDRFTDSDMRVREVTEVTPDGHVARSRVLPGEVSAWEAALMAGTPEWTEPNPHVHCSMGSSEPCPTGEHVNPYPYRESDLERVDVDPAPSKAVKRPFVPTNLLAGTEVQVTGWRGFSSEHRVEYVTRDGGYWESRWCDERDLEPLPGANDDMEGEAVAKAWIAVDTEIGTTVITYPSVEEANFAYVYGRDAGMSLMIHTHTEDSDCGTFCQHSKSTEYDRMNNA